LPYSVLMDVKGDREHSKGRSRDISCWHERRKNYARTLVVIDPGPACTVPMLVLARRVEHAFDAAVQRPHDTDASEHRRPVMFDEPAPAWLPAILRVCLCTRCDECCFETPRRSTSAQYYHATIARRKAKEVGPEDASFTSSEARQPRRQSCRLWAPTPSKAVRLRSPEPDLPLRPPRPCQRTHGSRPDRPGG
jgi:hypothetical protein